MMKAVDLESVRVRVERSGGTLVKFTEIKGPALAYLPRFSVKIRMPSKMFLDRFEVLDIGADTERRLLLECFKTLRRQYPLTEEDHESNRRLDAAVRSNLDISGPSVGNEHGYGTAPVCGACSNSSNTSHLCNYHARLASTGEL